MDALEVGRLGGCIMETMENEKKGWKQKVIASFRFSVLFFTSDL